MSPSLAGRFLTTGPPGQSSSFHLLFLLLKSVPSWDQKYAPNHYVLVVSSICWEMQLSASWAGDKVIYDCESLSRCLVMEVA